MPNVCWFECLGKPQTSRNKKKVILLLRKEKDLSFKASVYVACLSFGVHLLLFMKLGFNMQFFISGNETAV